MNLIIQLSIFQLQEIQKTQDMVRECTNQGSGGHATTPRKGRPREFKSPTKRRRDADRTETLVRVFQYRPNFHLTSTVALVARADE